MAKQPLSKKGIHAYEKILVMFFFSVIFMFFLMKFRYLRVLIGFVIAHLLTWGFLCYRGRVIDRVAIPLLFAECLFLLFTVLSMTDIGQVFEKKKIFMIFVYCPSDGESGTIASMKMKYRKKGDGK